MLNQRMGIAVSSLALLSVALAGCTMEGFGSATGTVIFCVQDDPTVNFSGVFVNFGNVQVNTMTTGNNTINDNDQVIDEGDGTVENTTAGNETSANTTAPADETTTNPTTSAAPTTSVATTQATTSGGGAQTIQSTDVECNRVAARGNFDFDVNGQQNFETGDGENPGRGDENRGRSDSPCDHDQGFGNDWKCDEDGRASKDIDVESGEVNLIEFQDRRAAYVARAELPPVTLDDVCFTIDDVRVTMKDGTDRQVDVEIGQVCVDGPIEVREGHETLVVLKVDLQQSIQETGDTIVFNPVLNLKVSAPVTQTIVIHETVTVSATTTATGNETTNATMTTTTSTTATFGTNETASPTTSPTNTTSP